MLIGGWNDVLFATGRTLNESSPYQPGITLYGGLTPSPSEATKIFGWLEAFDYIKEPTRSDYIDAARIYRICRAKGYTIRSTVDCMIAQLCLRDAPPLLSKDRFPGR